MISLPIILLVHLLSATTMSLCYKSSTCCNFSKNQIDALLALNSEYFLYGVKRVLKRHKAFDQNHEIKLMSLASVENTELILLMKLVENDVVRTCSRRQN